MAYDHDHDPKYDSNSYYLKNQISSSKKYLFGEPKKNTLSYTGSFNPPLEAPMIRI